MLEETARSLWCPTVILATGMVTKRRGSAAVVDGALDVFLVKQRRCWLRKVDPVQPVRNIVGNGIRRSNREALERRRLRVSLM